MRSDSEPRFLNKLLPDSPIQPESGIQVDRFWLVIIVAVAVLLRIAAALYLGDQVVNLPGTQDQVSYDMLAQQVWSGQGFTVAEAWWPATRAGEPTAHWSYLYTLCLAAVYSLFGHHPLIARLIQAIVAGILMPWLAFRLGRRYFGSRIGLIAAGLTAVYIYFVYYAATLMTETFYIIAILWTLDVAGQLGQTSEISDSKGGAPKIEWVWLGLALATTVLLRQVFVLFLPVLFAWLLWRSYRHHARPVSFMIGTLVGATVILVLSIVPWTIRNYRAFDEFVLLNTNAGFAFFWGNHPIHGYNFISILPGEGPSYQDLIPADLRGLNEAEMDRALLKRGLGFIQKDPGRYLVLSVSRVKDYFKFWPSPESSLISNLSRVFSFGLLGPFMLLGLIYSLRRYSANTSILYLFIVTYTGIHLLTWALIRYRLPVDAILILFAGLALVQIQARLFRLHAKHQGYTLTPSHSRD
jgi:4-amino-4-deoxy-L-arabinose transferase-like glycosyltransferase